jgi:hypothetical protein
MRYRTVAEGGGNRAPTSFLLYSTNNGETVTIYGQGFSPSAGANYRPVQRHYSPRGVSQRHDAGADRTRRATTGPITLAVGAAKVSTAPTNSLSGKSAPFNTVWANIAVHRVKPGWR